MCFGGKGGGIGGILGDIVGAGADFLFPGAGIPLSLATGAGGIIGGTLGGLTSGKSFGQSLATGAESGLVGGATAGAGEALAGQGFFGTPGGGGISGLFGGGGGTTPASTAALPTGTSVAPGTAQLATGVGTGEGGTAAAGTSTAAPTSFGGKVLNYAEEHPFQLLSAGAAALPLLMSNRTPGLSTLENQANTANVQGTQLASALTTGNLPPGAQAAVDQATEAAKAQVTSRFASMGLSGSTQEAQALAGVDQAAAVNKFAFLRDATQTGLNEVGAANSLYEKIMQTEIQQDQETSNSIARIAAALAGGGGSRATA